ncbi:hypothetical protein U8V97_23705, partial [Priestia filamentosa]|uniref:hypothetical protein n=1 Tax=Priestia filamentosa TaxID=1402861 RepID=UPI00397E6DCB
MGHPKFIPKFANCNDRKKENVFLTLEVEGLYNGKPSTQTFSLSASSDYKTTAIVTASLAKILLEQPLKGVLFPFEFTEFDEVL